MWIDKKNSNKQTKNVHMPRSANEAETLGTLIIK